MADALHALNTLTRFAASPFGSALLRFAVNFF